MHFVVLVPLGLAIFLLVLKAAAIIVLGFIGLCLYVGYLFLKLLFGQDDLDDE
jgi:hypothetical protein